MSAAAEMPAIPRGTRRRKRPILAGILSGTFGPLGVLYLGWRYSVATLPVLAGVGLVLVFAPYWIGLAAVFMLMVGGYWAAIEHNESLGRWRWRTPIYVAYNWTGIGTLCGGVMLLFYLTGYLRATDHALLAWGVLVLLLPAYVLTNGWLGKRLFTYLSCRARERGLEFP